MALLRLERFAPDLLSPFDLSIEAGECFSLTGPSGTGKSLLLRAVADLDPHQGEAWLENKPAREFTPPEWRRQVAYLPAESHWWTPVVGDHFREPNTALVEALGLPAGVFDWKVARLSSGERQRLAVARLLGIRPRVLLLDETTANLDGSNTERVEKVISSYLAETNAAVLWVSHDPVQRHRVARRHLEIFDGRIEEREP